MVNILSGRIKKKDIAEYFQKLAMLLDTGYDLCSADELLTVKDAGRRRDSSADGVRRIANLLLPDLREGFSLNKALASHPKNFAEYVQQVEVGELSGRTGEVLTRISEQIKNSGKIMAKLKGALVYPAFTLVVTFAAAGYLFTNVVPDMLGMLMEISTEDIPGTTQLVMNISAWLGSNGVALFVFIALIVGVIVFYAKTFGQMRMSKLAKDFPLIGRVIQNNSMVSFFRNWQQMILAGAEMSVALKSAAEAIPNRYIRREAMRAQHDYEENGIAVHEALRTISCLKALELQTIHVAMEGDRLPKVLGILAEDRELEAQKSINAMTAAVNPILMVIVGLIVGTLVLAIYQPIISVSSSLS